MSIINNILSLLETKKLKQIDLCNALGISSSTMTNWKNRETDPPAKYIIPICEFMNISPYQLLLGEENAFEEQAGINNNIYAGNMTNSKIIGGHYNNVSENTIYREPEDDSMNNGLYSELINHLETLSASKRRHALADLMDVLEENYPI